MFPLTVKQILRELLKSHKGKCKSGAFASTALERINEASSVVLSEGGGTGTLHMAVINKAEQKDYSD